MLRLAGKRLALAAFILWAVSVVVSFACAALVSTPVVILSGTWSVLPPRLVSTCPKGAPCESRRQPGP